MICTAKLGRALQEMGQTMDHISPEAHIQRLVQIFERYGYWLGSPEENAEVGIELA